MDAPTAFWMQWIGQLAACHRHLRRQLAVVASAEGLNDTEFLLLNCCRWAPPGELSQQHLAAHVGLSPSQASGVFESLRARGLLSSEPGVQDRRRQAWHITAAGQQRAVRIEDRLAPLFAQLQSCLSSTEQHMVLHLLQRLTAIGSSAEITAPSSAPHAAVQEAA
jgi:DNA-binding MarR family transcriptional regulator